MFSFSLLEESGPDRAHCECMRRFASLLIVFCKIDKLTLLNTKLINTLIKINYSLSTFRMMPGFKGKRKRALTLTRYKKQFRYRLPVSPPRKRTKTSSSTPNLKSPSIRTTSLLTKSVSI